MRMDGHHQPHRSHAFQHSSPPARKGYADLRSVYIREYGKHVALERGHCHI